MGTFHKTIEIGAIGAAAFTAMDALVDSGATFSVVPRRVLSALGVDPTRSDTFFLADGTARLYDMAWVQVRIDGRTELTLCVFGDESSSPLLGAVTLEAFLLGVDAVNRRLVPTPAYLA